MGSAERTGVALLQMGGPRRPDELAPFLRRLFTDPDMIQLPAWLRPLQGPLGSLYGTLRARKVREDYEAIGYSDIVETTRSLAARLDERLDGTVAGVRTAMRYTPPRADEAVRELIDHGADRLLAVTLYPFFSRATTGSSLNALEAARDRIDPDVPLEAIDRWGSHEGFLDLQAEWIRRLLDELPDERRAVLLTAHGLPQAYIHDGDPYRQEVERAGDGIAERLPEERVELAFQSDVGPVEWMRPYTDEAVEALARDGTETLLIVPFGFVSEHIETLYEIDEEYAEEAREAGIETVERVPAFDDDPAFAAFLADLIHERLGDAA